MMKVVLKQGMLTCFPSIFKRNARCPVDSNPGILIWMTKAFLHLLLKLERKVWLYWQCFLPHNNETMTEQIFWFNFEKGESLRGKILWENLSLIAFPRTIWPTYKPSSRAAKGPKSFWTVITAWPPTGTHGRAPSSCQCPGWPSSGRRQTALMVNQAFHRGLCVKRE